MNSRGTPHHDPPPSLNSFPSSATPAHLAGRGPHHDDPARVLLRLLSSGGSVNQPGRHPHSSHRNTMPSNTFGLMMTSSSTGPPAYGGTSGAQQQQQIPRQLATGSNGFYDSFGGGARTKTTSTPSATYHAGSYFPYQQQRDDAFNFGVVASRGSPPWGAPSRRSPPHETVHHHQREGRRRLQEQQRARPQAKTSSGAGGGTGWMDEVFPDLYKQVEMIKRENPLYAALTEECFDLHIVMPITIPYGTIAIDSLQGENYYEFPEEEEEDNNNNSSSGDKFKTVRTLFGRKCKIGEKENIAAVVQKDDETKNATETTEGGGDGDDPQKKEAREPTAAVVDGESKKDDSVTAMAGGCDSRTCDNKSGDTQGDTEQQRERENAGAKDVQCGEQVCDTWASFLRVHLGTVYNVPSYLVADVCKLFNQTFKTEALVFYKPLVVECEGVYRSPDSSLLSQRTQQQQRNLNSNHKPRGSVSNAGGTKAAKSEDSHQKEELPQTYETRGVLLGVEDRQRFALLLEHVERFSRETIALHKQMTSNGSPALPSFRLRVGDAFSPNEVFHQLPMLPEMSVELHQNCKVLETGKIRILIREFDALSEKVLSMVLADDAEAAPTETKTSKTDKGNGEDGGNAERETEETESRDDGEAGTAITAAGKVEDKVKGKESDEEMKKEQKEEEAKEERSSDENGDNGESGGQVDPTKGETSQARKVDRENDEDEKATPETEDAAADKGQESSGTKTPAEGTTPASNKRRKRAEKAKATQVLRKALQEMVSGGGVRPGEGSGGDGELETAMDSARVTLAEIRLEHTRLRMVDPRWSADFVIGRRLADCSPGSLVPTPHDLRARYVFCGRSPVPKVKDRSLDVTHGRAVTKTNGKGGISGRMQGIMNAHVAEHPEAMVNMRKILGLDSHEYGKHREMYDAEREPNEIGTLGRTTSKLLMDESSSPEKNIMTTITSQKRSAAAGDPASLSAAETGTTTKESASPLGGTPEREKMDGGGAVARTTGSSPESAATKSTEKRKRGKKGGKSWGEVYPYADPQELYHAHAHSAAMTYAAPTAMDYVDGESYYPSFAASGYGGYYGYGAEAGYSGDWSWKPFDQAPRSRKSRGQHPPGVCRFFMGNGCAHGDSCSFFHPADHRMTDDVRDFAVVYP